MPETLNLFPSPFEAVDDAQVGQGAVAPLTVKGMLKVFVHVVYESRAALCRAAGVVLDWPRGRPASRQTWIRLPHVDTLPLFTKRA